MKNEHLILLAVVAYFLYEQYVQQQVAATAGTVSKTVSGNIPGLCSDPATGQYYPCG